MAAQQPKKRPTQAQIRRSQKRLIGYLAKSGKPLDVAANQLKVSKKQLENYLFQARKTTRRVFSRSEAYQRLYEQAGNKGGIADVKRVPRIQVKPYVDKNGEIRETVTVKDRNVTSEARRRASILVHSVMLEQKTTEAQASIEWQIYASERNIPTSIVDIKDMYQSGDISRRQAMSFFNHWANIYSIDLDDREEMAEDWGFDDEYDDE